MLESLAHRTLQPADGTPRPSLSPRAASPPAGLHEALLGTLEAAGAGLAIVGPQGFEDANDAFLALAGRTLAELHATRPSDLLGLDLAALPAQAKVAADLAVTEGQRIAVEIHVSPLRDDAARPPRLLLLVQDARARRTSADELETARRQVAQSEKLSVLGSLVSGLAHEIRTPLAYLDNHVNLIETRIGRALQHDTIRPELLADLPGHLASAHEGVDRINRLVKDLRRFIKMEVGARRSVPLDEVVRDALRLFEAAHRGRATIEADLQPTPLVTVDATQIQQIVINLLDNAADATSGQAPVQVSTRVADNGAAELVVKDHGIGMPPEVLERMYDPFFSTKQEGTGLGLAIVRRIVESHGGTLDCESMLGEGTTFRVALPAEPAPAA